LAGGKAARNWWSASPRINIPEKDSKPERWTIYSNEAIAVNSHAQQEYKSPKYGKIITPSPK
jgi:hypothetical protein